MSKVGADDFVNASGATAEDFNGLPREEIMPPLIHLVDLERTEYVGRQVQTDIVIAGVGEAFHVPRSWEFDCGQKAQKKCSVCPATIDLKERKELLNFCRMTDDQKMGYMRKLARCRNKPTLRVKAMATITEILAVPVASPSADGPPRDYREKVVALIGTLPHSHIRYRATGEVIAEPKRQRASLLITRLERLQSAAEGFVLTTELRAHFEVFQVHDPGNSTPESLLNAASRHLKGLTHDVTRHITKIYGDHREKVLLGLVLTLHSPAEIPWEGEAIKGVIDGLVIGDTGQGKTTQSRRLINATGLGRFSSGSTASRTGVLYNLDSKVNDKRILRWGAFPLAHGEALLLDEAQNMPREEWRQFTTARSEGVLRVERSLQAEHPSRVRLVCFANPPGNRPMAAFQYGIMTVHPESGFLDPQDLRRFDFVACVAEGDHPTGEILAAMSEDGGPQRVPPDVLRDSILWAWTRDAGHIRYAPNTEDAIKAMARALNERFGTPEMPLLITDAHEKVARLAVAFAAFLHNTDATHEQVIVTPLHVALVGRFLETLYTHPNCAFDQYAAVLRRRAGLTEEEYQTIVTELLTPGSNREDVFATEAILELFLTEDQTPKSDLEAATGLGKDGLNGRIRKLREHRLILTGRAGYRKTPRFVAFLRRWAEARPNPSNPPNQAPGNPAGGVSP